MYIISNNKFGFATVCDTRPSLYEIVGTSFSINSTQSTACLNSGAVLNTASITSKIGASTIITVTQGNIIIDKTIEYIETAPKKYTETGKSPIVQIMPIAKSLRMYFICINLSLPCTQS